MIGVIVGGAASLRRQPLTAPAHTPSACAHPREWTTTTNFYVTGSTSRSWAKTLTLIAPRDRRKIGHVCMLGIRTLYPTELAGDWCCTAVNIGVSGTVQTAWFQLTVTKTGPVAYTVVVTSSGSVPLYSTLLVTMPVLASPTPYTSSSDTSATPPHHHASTNAIVSTTATNTTLCTSLPLGRSLYSTAR